MLFPPTSLVEGAQETQAHCVLTGKDPLEPDRGTHAAPTLTQLFAAVHRGPFIPHQHVADAPVNFRLK
jgi:hypothetical protein